MRSALAALFAEFRQRDFALHFLLVLGSEVVGALADAALEADEIIL